MYNFVKFFVYLMMTNVTVKTLSPPQRLLFFKKPRKKGKGGKRERRKNGKGGKSAREMEKRRKPVPDFCRNMAPARGVVVHCDACICWAVEQRILRMAFLNFNNRNK